MIQVVAKKVMPKEIGICTFCPQVAVLTGEHIWSQWMGKLLGKDAYLIIQRDKNRNIIKAWRRKRLDKKILVVCEKCNTQVDE